MITAGDGSFNSVIRFYDTKNVKQPHLFGNGLRLAGVTPHMVLKNTGSAPITVRPQFIAQGGLAASEPVVLHEINLGANETTEVDLSPLTRAVRSRHDLAVVSVRVNNSGAPGTLIGSLYGLDDSKELSYDTPLRDSGPARAMTGSYPWKITKDYTTVVYITNISDISAEFVTQINYDGGKFVIDPRKLEPGETAVFDLRKIRDEQAGDNVGRKLPKLMAQGQFKWAVRGDTKGKQVLVGRAEMVSRTQQVSTSYSCNDPCPPSYGADLNPFPPPVVVTGSATTAAWETAYYDWGGSTGPYAVWAAWTLDAQVGTLNPDSGHSTNFTGTAPGMATLDAFIGLQNSYSWDGRDCYYNYTYEEHATCVAEVTPMVGKIQYQSGSNFVDVSGTLYVYKGTSVTFKAVPDPPEGTFPSGQPTWGGTSGASGTGETTSVTFNTDSSTINNPVTVTATSGNTVTVNVIVYELTGIFTPQDNFAGRSTSRYGLLERVNLTYSSTPGAVPAAQAGGLVWKIVSGSAN